MTEKAIIAMSGGVDSSVCAHIMKSRGYDCNGVMFRLYDKPGADELSSDITDAERVSEKVGIPFSVIDYREEFKRRVIDEFVSVYENGGTPNPCIVCNRVIKFELLFRLMEELCADKVVTGHYARVEYDSSLERYLLKRAVDLSKDQSYVLYNLKKHQLKHIIFPLGELSKSEARQIAETEGFVNAAKRDSQDICFIPDGDYGKFIENYRGKEFPSGEFVDSQGHVLGRHKGIIHYTVGQRKGLGLSLPCPMYVVKKTLSDNRVVLGYNEDLFSDRLTAKDVNLISVDSIDAPMRVEAKVRYSQKAQPACAEILSDGRLSVVFDEPQRAITPGQSVVLYDGDIVVGGGTIE